MTVKDWAALGMLVVTAIGMYVNVRVSMALRERDRQDFEKLRGEHDELQKEVTEFRLEVARGEGGRG